MTEEHLYTIYFFATNCPLSTIKCRGISDDDAIEVAKLKLAQQNFKDVRFISIERSLKDD
jgi:hypothetical protein